MVKIIESIIKEGQTNQRPGHAMKPKYITVHNTANPNEGANAEMHARYLHNGAGGRVVSWHFTVDDTEIYQHLPLDENGWHAGDGGSGTGNRESIGIEICENSDGAFGKAVANAVWLIQKLMKEHNIGIENVVPHKHWSGKDCPRKLLDQWQGFIKRVENSEASPPKQKGQYKGNSIVDYLSHIGQDSSFAYRKKLATQYKIKNYRGTAAQNLQLLNILRTQTVVSKPKGNLKTTSIVDYLKSINVDSSFNNRKKLAAEHGIRNYKGTAAQNSALLNKLRE